MPARALLALLLLVAALAMAWLAVYQVDDAFIVYRYAAHLAAGDGFVFNPGERVEGVTCFLWTLALVPWAAAGADLPAVAPWLTGLCGLATLALVARRSADVDGRDAIAPRDLLPALLLAGMPAFVYWSAGALETIPFTLLVAASVRDLAGRPGRSAVWMGLACLTRPEAPLIAAAIALHVALDAGWRRTARWLGVAAAFSIALALFRRAYFGEWLPNTYYAKTGLPLAMRVQNGWGYLSESVGSLVPSFGVVGPAVEIAGWLLVAALVLFAVRAKALRPEALVVLSVLAATLFNGGDWMVLHRMVVPALPALAVLAGTGLARAAARGGTARAVVAAVVAVAVGSGSFAAAKERNGGRGLAVNAAGYRHAHLEIARYLAANARPGEAVALMDVGMVGWALPQLRIIDITGLTDRAIAHAPGGFLDKRYPIADLLARDPRYLVLVPRFPIDERIHSDPGFAARYRFLYSVNHRFNWDPPSEYNLSLFERIPS